MSTPGQTDRELDALLRGVLTELDAPPPAFVESAKAALTWLTVDAELAQLASDSRTEPAGVRSHAPPRVLTFSCGDTTLVVEVADERRARRVIGQIVAPAAATVEVRHAEGTTSVRSDEHGRFRAAPIPSGPLSITCRFDDPTRAAVVTSWVTA